MQDELEHTVWCITTSLSLYSIHNGKQSNHHSTLKFTLSFIKRTACKYSQLGLNSQIYQRPGNERFVSLSLNNVTYDLSLLGRWDIVMLQAALASHIKNPLALNWHLITKTK